MPDMIAVLNAGSSSIKFSLFAITDDEFTCELRGQIAGLHTAPRFRAQDAQGTLVAEHAWPADTRLQHDEALEFLTHYLHSALGERRLVGIGHRVVQGGTEFLQPVRVDADVLEKLARFIPFMPLHQPHNLAAIRRIAERLPEVPQVACFDTSFHQSNPPVAQLFALPGELYAEGVRRYGFHGLSFEYVASVLPQVDPRAAAGRTIVLHLGNGVSLCALAGGRSQATTMGFSSLDGIPMGTRCGSLDPGVILYLLNQRGLAPHEIEQLLYTRSGLLGVSGVSSDMRTLLKSSAPRAQLAVDLFVYRIGRELGSLAAVLGGIDALVFTAGIGENSAEIRERICREAAWLGLDFATNANAAGGPRLSRPNSRVSAWVIPTHEELMIARHTRRLLFPAQRSADRQTAPSASDGAV
ncbi:MAG: acetate/propionate family kinase [Pirellulales bacterium]